MEVMREHRETWVVVKAVVVICPAVTPQRVDLEMVQKAVPEALRLQPATMHREILVWEH